MITQEQIQGNWDEVEGRIKQHWGNITDDELQQCEGSVERLIGLVQRKSGQAREDIEETLHDWFQRSSSAFASSAAAVQDYAAQATDVAKQQFQHAQNMVKRHPAESAIICFGTGLLIGVVVGLVSRSR